MFSSCHGKHGHLSLGRDAWAGLTALVGRQGVYFHRLVHAEEITVMAISLPFPSDPRLDGIFPSSYNVRELC